MENNTEKMEGKIEKILIQVRPYIEMHGGDVSLVDIKNGIVKLKVSGACADCYMSHVTFDEMLGGMIKEGIPEIKDIIIEN
jgi:Fe-S cluster biogenesis protein NfuA